MYNRAILVHATVTSNHNPFLGLVNCEFPFRKRSVHAWCPDFISIWLLSFDMLKETLIVETGVITTWNCNLMAVNTIGSSAVHAEFAGN